MRTPEPTPEAGAGPHVASGGRRLNGRRRLAETLRGRWPWLVWGLALVGALALYGQIGRPGRAIGEAELRTFALAPPDRARVISIDVQLGDRVSAGQVLAVLDSAALDGELGETEALMEQLRKELERERTERTREYLESTGKISGGAEDTARRLAAARAEQARLQGELGATEREIARQQGLVGQQLTSAALLAELQQKQAARREEKAGMDAAVALLAQQAAASHRRLEQWRSATAPEGPGGSRDAAGAPDAALAPAPLAHYLAPIEAAIRVEERKRQRLLAEREAYRLRAPVDATVGFIHLRTGEVSGPELPVLTVVAPASDRVIAYAGEDDADGIRVGMRAHLRPRDGSGAERRGTVVFVAPAYSPLPYRYQILRNRPAWCRQALVRLDPLPAGEPLPVPGEAFDLAFFAGDGLLPGRDDLAHGPAVTEPATRELAP